MDWKEYSRLRSIARKRIERASAKGQTKYVQIPTVKEVKASLNPQKYYEALKNFVEKVPTLRESKGNKIPKFEVKSTKKRKPLTEEQRARKREADRRYRARKKIRETAGNEQQARKQEGYLKALETVAKRWREGGVDIGNWIGVMSPNESKAFVDYMEYRFAQGDYNSRYTIDTFIRDFGELHKAGYNLQNIKDDFNNFLLMEKDLKKRKRNTDKYGMSHDDFDMSWRKFVKANTGNW